MHNEELLGTECSALFQLVQDQEEPDILQNQTQVTVSHDDVVLWVQFKELFSDSGHKYLLTVKDVSVFFKLSKVTTKNKWQEILTINLSNKLLAPLRFIIWCT